MKDKVVVVTGGANGIGKCIVDTFRDLGAHVCVIDIKENDYFVGDLSNQKTLETFVNKVIGEYEKIDYLINNAAPLNKGISSCTYEEFMFALSVGVTAPFYLSKLFRPYFNEGGSIVNISSTRDHMSQAETESYSASKGGISALTHAMAMSFAGKIRVNAISPGWIDTSNSTFEKEDCLQHPAGRVGKPEDIAKMVVYLCSEDASFINGENICIDGGMTKQMIYHNDYGWKYNPEEK